MKVTVDRIEEDFLVVLLPDGKSVNMAKCLCTSAKEGDIIDILLDNDAKNDREERIKSKLELLKKTK